jgi:eukaryotic-like serine/threonine-protein kinase
VIRPGRQPFPHDQSRAAGIGQTWPVNPLGAASVVGGRFRLIEPVRSGDPGGAWRAVDEESGAEVAVKAVGVYLAGDVIAQARFRHAARAVLQLAGPGIAQVRDYGESPLPDSRVMLYLVRDLASGQALDQRLAEGPLAAGETVRLAAAAAAALETAHQAGMPHGHLVPSNIVLGAGTVTVTDFGLPVPPDGHAGAPAGLSYLAPELGDGSPATPAADMYALGVVVIACLAGIGSAAAAGTNGTAVPGALALEPVPAAIAALWASCLGPDPVQRPTADRAVTLSQQVLSAQALAGPAPAASSARQPRRARLAARDLLASPGRRLAGAGAAAALIAVIAVSALSSVGTRQAAHISPAPASGTSAPHTSSSPAGGVPGTEATGQPASPPPPAQAAASPQAALAAIQQLGQSIHDDMASGQMRQDVGLDMINLILPVMTELAAGEPAPVLQLTSTLRAKIATRLGEDGLTTAAATELTSELDALQRSAGGAGS